MVSKKISKRTPTKPPLKYRRFTRYSPVKSTASVVIKSIHTCQRRLVKLFTKLARITTQTPSPKKFKFHLLSKNDNAGLVPRDLFRTEEQNGCATRFLSPLSEFKKDAKPTVFLDLDETLVHSTPHPPPEKWDFIVRPRIDGRIVTFYVLKRPGVDEFLERLKGKFEVVVFTAGLREYASLVLDELDKGNVVDYRLYRDACREVEGKFVKDLRVVGNGRDMRRVVIVDDNPGSYECNPENAVPVRPFVYDLEDCELGKLSVFFDGLCGGDGVEDLRVAVKEYLASC